MVDHLPYTTPPAPLTRLIGRAEEIAAICGLIRSGATRLVTLTGPGGIGKTRLAIQAIEELRRDVADRVSFVSLASLRDARQIIPTLGRLFGVTEASQRPILEQLRDEIRAPHLIVLDNFEHLLTAAGQIAEALRLIPSLTLLVTSRTPLRIAGEQLFPVPPLALPTPDDLRSPEHISNVPAVALFAQRVRAVVPNFRITHANAVTIAEICARLDGLPLAIELAAARGRLLAPADLLARLNKRLHVLTEGPRDLPARQQTLRQTIDWSYDLLSAPEQMVFARLAIFVGDFTFAAVEAILPDEDATNEQISINTAQQPDQRSKLDIMQALVDQSMLQSVASSDGAVRFVMLESLREYALERLEARGEVDLMRERHAAYYLTMAEAAACMPTEQQQAQARHQLTMEICNLRAALAGMLERRLAEPATRMVVALGRFWEVYDHLSEGQRAINAALALDDTPALTPEMRAYALYTAGALARHQGDYAVAHCRYTASLDLLQASHPHELMIDVLGGLGEIAFRQGEYVNAHTHYAQSLEIARTLGDQRRVADALNGLGRIALAQGDRPDAMRLLSEGLAICRAIQYRRGIAWASNALGEIARARADSACAASLFAESMTHFEEVGDCGARKLALQNRAFALLAQGLLVEAEESFTEALALWQHGGARHGLALALIGLAGVRGAQGEAIHAARLLGAADTLLASIGAQLEIPDRTDYDRIYRSIQKQIGAPAFVAAYETGRNSALDDVLASLDKVSSHAAASSPSINTQTHPTDLTAREIDVLRLVARGLTNAQIAEHLMISPLTVNVHLRSIYRKLDVTTRAAATRFAVEHGL